MTDFGSVPEGVDPRTFNVAEWMVDQQNARVRAAVDYSMRTDPDTYAEADRMARELGMSVESVTADMDNARTLLQKKALESMQFRERNPVLAERFRHTRFTTMARDDIGNLVFTEGDWDWIGRSWGVARDTSRRGTIGQAAMFEGRELSLRERRELERMQNRAQVSAERDDGIFSSAIKLVGSTVDSLAAGAAAGAVVGAAAPPLAPFAAGAAAFTQSFRLEAGNLYADLIENGYTPAEAAPIAMRWGAAIGAVDLVGLKVAAAPLRETSKALLGKLASRAVSDQGRAALLRDVLKGYGKALLVEPSTEYVQEIMGMLAEQEAARAYQPANVRDLDWGRADEAFVETFKGMLVVGAVGAGGHTMLDLRRAANADHQARVMAQLAKREEESKLGKRSPDDRAEVVNELAQGSGADTVYVEGGKLLEVLTELEAAEAKESGRASASETLDQLMPGLLAEARQAAETGGDVKIPTGDFVAKLGKTELGRRLWNDHATFDPDTAMTGAERRGFDRSKALEEYRAASERAMAVDEEVAASAREVEDIIYTGLRNAKGERWTDKHGNRVDARSQAVFFRDFIVTQAADLGISPREFYNRYPLQIGTGDVQADVAGTATPRWAEQMPEFAALQRGESTPQQFVNAVQRRLDAEGADADGISAWQMLAARNPELRGKRRKTSRKALLRNMLRQAKDYAETIEVWERPEMSPEQREAFRKARARRGGPDILSYIRQAGGLTREQWQAAGVDLEVREAELKRRGLLRGKAEGTFSEMAEALDADGYLGGDNFEMQVLGAGGGNAETAFLDAVNAALDGQLVVSQIDGFTPEMMEAMAEEWAGKEATPDVDEFEFGDDDVLFQTDGIESNERTFYHGTPTGGFSRFDPSRIGSGAGRARGGFSFTSSPDVAQAYAKGFDNEDAATVDAVARINPLLARIQPQEGYPDWVVGDGAPVEWDWTSFGEGGRPAMEELHDDAAAIADVIRPAQPELADEIMAALAIESPSAEVIEVRISVPDDVTTIETTREAYAEDVAGVDVRREPGGMVLVELQDTGESVLFVADPDKIRFADGRDAAANTMFDTDAEGERRGGFRANDPRAGNRPSINLYAAADASTFLHESAHFFLHVYGDLAARGEATPRMQQDMQTLLDWFGVKDVETWNAMTLEQQREHHEAFAASYELYLSEGEAPSSALGRVFQKFGRWLRTIYRTIRDDLNAIHKREFGKDLPVLTDDVRRVMDRMVASEDQVAQAEAVRSLARTFEEQAESGMTDEEWESYLEDHQVARDLAVDELTRRSLRGVGWLRRARERARRAVNREAREARKALEAEVEREVDTEPVNRARHFLRTGELRDEQGQVVEVDPEASWQSESATPKLNREQARALLPEGANLNALHGLTSEDGGLSPDSVARLFGYDSGQAMVEDMATAPSRRSSIDIRTDARMIEERSDLATPEAVQSAIELALHNEIRGKILAEEFKRAAAVSSPTREQTVAANEAAKEHLRTRRVGDIRPRDYSLAETRARRRAAEALRAGDMDAFALEKRHELLQHHLAREAAAVREEMGKSITQMQRVFGNDEKQAKTRDTNILRAARAMLAMFGLDAGATTRSPMAWLAPVKDYDETTYAELEPEVLRVATLATEIDGEADRKWRKLTLDQFRELGEAIDALWHKSRRSRQIELNGQRQDREVVAQRMVETLIENGAEVPEVDRPRTALQKVGDWLRSYFANATRVEQLMRNLDGGKEGVFTSLFRRIKDAGNAYRKELREKVERYEALLRAHDWGPNVQIDAKKELGKIFQNKAEVLGVLRHLGNDSNKKKALISEGWATLRDDGSLDSTVWDDWLRKQIQAGKVTKADFDLVQAIWDLHEEIKPDLQRAHYRNYGYYFREVEARSFEVVFPGGEVARYRGGYVPATPRTDGNVSATAHEIDTVAKFNGAFASVPRGMTKERNEAYRRKLEYNLASGATHIGAALRFIHMQEAVSDVQRVLLHRDVERVLTAKNQALYKEALFPWLKRAALQQTSEVESNKALNLIGRIASNVNMSIMFGNVTNAAQNVTGLVEALTRVKPKHLFGAVSSYMANPRGATRDAVAKSTELANRQGRQMVEIRQQIKKTTVQPNAVQRAGDWFREHGYFLQTITQNVVDTIVWTGAYNEAIANGVTEAEAVQRGDAAIRQTQMATDPEDVSYWESKGSFMRALFPFQSWFIRWANNQVGSWQHAPTAGARMAIVIYGYMLPLVLAQLMSDLLRGRLADEDDDGWGDDLGSMALRSMVSGSLAAVPVFGKPIEAIVNTWADDDVWNNRMPSSPIVGTFERALRAAADLTEGDADVRDVQDIVGFFGNLAGVPLGAITSRLTYAYREAQGDVQPGGPFGPGVDYARGLLTGR